MTSRGNRVAQVEANESSPLNHIQDQNEQNDKLTMDAETKRVLTKIVIDIVLLGCGKYCNKFVAKYLTVYL